MDKHAKTRAEVEQLIKTRVISDVKSTTKNCGTCCWCGKAFETGHPGAYVSTTRITFSAEKADIAWVDAWTHEEPCGVEVLAAVQAESGRIRVFP